jgi:hypothetical protein
MKNKKVKLKLVGLDGNSFCLLGTFKQAAKQQGWTTEEIQKVVNEAMSGDYNHLLYVISSHCQ